jgi:hypothetical protein
MSQIQGVLKLCVEQMKISVEESESIISMWAHLKSKYKDVIDGKQKSESLRNGLQDGLANRYGYEKANRLISIMRETGKTPANYDNSQTSQQNATSNVTSVLPMDSLSRVAQPPQPFTQLSQQSYFSGWC